MRRMIFLVLAATLLSNGRAFGQRDAQRDARITPLEERWAHLVDSWITPRIDDSQQAFLALPSKDQARIAAPTLLRVLDGLIRGSPNSPDLLISGASQYTGLALVMTRYEDEDAARKLYRKGMDYADRALAAGWPHIHAAITGVDRDALDRTLAHLRRDQVPAVYWWVLSKGSLTDLSRDDPDLVADVPRLVEIMTRVAEVWPEYYDGGADAFLGHFYLGRSSAIGGSYEKGKAHFEAAIRIASDRFLLYSVFYAEGLKNQRVSRATRTEYERVLRGVLEAEGVPERALITSLAKDRARILLGEIDEHFPADLIELADE